MFTSTAALTHAHILDLTSILTSKSTKRPDTYLFLSAFKIYNNNKEKIGIKKYKLRDEEKGGQGVW